MIEAEVERSKALTWVAVLMDQAFDKANEVNCVKAELIGAMNHPKQICHKLEKLLIVSEPMKTTVYMTLKAPEMINHVKRILERLFISFGDEVVKRADKSLHVMNMKDKNRIAKWQLASDFQTDMFEEVNEDISGKRARHKGPACLENLGEWADETEMIPAVGAASSSDQIVKHAADTMNMLTKQLEDLQMKEETIKREKEKKSEKLQHIAQLQAIMDKTKGDDDKLDLGYEISKLYTELDQLTSNDTLDDIENERSCLQKQLGKMRLEKDLLDEYCADAILQVIDYGPGVPLYVVLKMKEEERREFIIDRLPIDMSQKVHAYKKATG